MWLIVFMIIIIAAKNAEMISQLWLEKQRIKQEILCTNKTKEE
mgnify:CR=1 FL=1